MRKRLNFLIFKLFGIIIFGQTGSIIDNVNKIYPAAPTSNNLMKFEEVPINYYTGIPDISIPLISIPTTSSNVNVKIELKYHPLSAKAEDRASEVGLGWSLIAGGTITRTVKGGLADNLTASVRFSSPPKSVLGIYEPENKINDCYLGNCQNYTTNQLNEFTYYGVSGKWDTEYDLYQYNFMGITGRFFVIKDSFDKLIVKKLDRNNLKIECNMDEDNVLLPGINPLLFKITDENGIKYIFNTLEKSNNYTSFLKGADPGFNIEAESVSAFHLNKVLNQNNQLLINYLYSDERLQKVSQNQQITLKFPITQSLTNAPPLSDISNYGLHSNWSTTTTTTKTKHLLKIQILGKGDIVFDYQKGREDSNYEDNTQLYKLVSISSGISSAGTFLPIEKFDLEYNSYTNTKYNERLTGILKSGKKMLLTKIKRKDPNNNNIFSYNLSYNQSNEELKIDPWGYYKGSINSGIVTDVLDYMILPTGGKIKYNFEENVFSYKPTINIEGVNLVEDQFEYENSSSQIEFQEYNDSNKFFFFELNHNQIVKLESYIPDAMLYSWKLNVFKEKAGGGFNAVPDFIIESKKKPIGPCQMCPPDDDPNDNPQGNDNWTIPDLDYYAKELNSGRYFATFVSKENNLAFPEFNYFKSYFSIQRALNTNYVHGGGLRIRSINYYKSTSDVEKSIEYDYKDIDNPALSSGALAYPIPIFGYKEGYKSKGTLPNYDGHIFSATYSNSTNYNILPVQKTQGGDVGYQYVTVREKNNNEDLGKTIYKFTSPIDKPGEYPFYCNLQNLVLPIRPLPNNDYERGLQLEETKFNKSGEVLTHKLNSYTYMHDSENTGYLFIDGMYNSVETARSKYIGQQVFDANSGFNNVGTFQAVIEHFGTSKLSSTEEESFFYENGKKGVVTKKDFVYNSNDLPIYTKTEFPDHNIIEENKSYATEVPDSNLTGANMIGIPLITETKNNGKTISKTETVYENLLPKYVNSYSLGSTNAKQEIRFDLYDERGNLRQYTTKDGNSVTVIWGYNQSQPIVKIEGAKYSDVQLHLGDIIALSDADFYAGTNNDESALTIALDNFRNKPNLSAYQITTYTFDPLVGVRTITPPSGITATYIYDSANRLDKIVDSNGNILKEYKYSYKQ